MNFNFAKFFLFVKIFYYCLKSELMSKLIPVILSILFAFNLSAQCIPGFEYYVNYTVDNTAGSQNLNNHQVSITLNTLDLISAGKMNADGSDIRFFDNACNPLCHYIESGLNTTNTTIWVKVSSIPQAASTSITLQYGNPAAISTENGNCTFDFLEDFNDGQFNFVDSCGSSSLTTDGTYGTIIWTGSGMYRSAFLLTQGSSYTVEAMVMGIAGNWPAIHFYKTNDRSYALMTDVGSQNVRISEQGSVAGLCTGHNWASDLFGYSNPNGLWSLTWVATGDLRAKFPSVADFNSTSTLYPLDSDLAVAIGGIASGEGNFMQVDWLRARKFSPTPIAITAGLEMIVDDVPVPTLGQWSLIILSLSMGIVGLLKFKLIPEKIRD